MIGEPARTADGRVTPHRDGFPYGIVKYINNTLQVIHVLVIGFVVWLSRYRHM